MIESQGSFCQVGVHLEQLNEHIFGDRVSERDARKHQAFAMLAQQDLYNSVVEDFVFFNFVQKCSHGGLAEIALKLMDDLQHQNNVFLVSKLKCKL